MTNIYDYWGEQDIYYNIGKSGCYFLSICRMCQQWLEDKYKIAHEIDIVNIYKQALKLNYIRKDCYLYNPSGLCELITGYKWWVEKKDKLEIETYKNKKYYTYIWCQPNNIGGNHFACRHYEPLGHRVGTNPISYGLFYVFTDKE